MVCTLKWLLSGGTIYVIADVGMFHILHITGSEYDVQPVHAGLDAIDASEAVFDCLESHGVYLIDDPTLPESDVTYKAAWFNFLKHAGIDSATMERVEVTLSGE